MRHGTRKGFKDRRFKYFVEDNGILIPVKEKLRELIKSGKVKLSKSNFTTYDALRELKKLGFKVVKMEDV